MSGLFEVSFATAVLYTLAYFGLIAIGFIPAVGWIADLVIAPLLVPLFFVGLGLWGLVILSSFLTNALFWVILGLVVLVYFEYKSGIVSKVLQKRAGVR